MAEKNSYTHYATGGTSDSIISVTNGFAGPLHVVPDLDSGDRISNLDTVTITGAATVVATGLTKESDGTTATYTVPQLTTIGTYTVTATVTTNGGQTIVTTGTLIVT